MDFFQRQDAARKSTKWLVVYFALAVAGIILSVYLAVTLLFAGVKAKQHRYADYDSNQPQLTLWQPQLFLGVAAGVLAIIGCGSAYKVSALSGGGSTVAESLGGRLVSSNTTDLNERKLLNVVEEMSIASGVPMPQVYVMDGESGINAFAAGHTPSDAAVSVTRGCIESLKRDELQGVIGHEFSHILNGDMRLNLRLMGIIFGIVCLTVIGRILLRFRSSGKNQNPLPILGLLLIVIGGVGAFFANLIQAAVSRQREFLADASSVQFTRNPSGLSSALQKIGSAGSQLESEHASEASHMFFCNGLKSSFFNAFATHPPLEERIKAIDPTWDGKFKPITRLVEPEPPKKKSSAPPVMPFPPIFGMPGMAGASGLSGAMLSGSDETIWQKPPPVRSQDVMPSLGNPTPLHLRYAQEMREAMPENIKLAAREPQTAAALIYALLLHPDADIAARQLAELSARAGDSIHEKVVALRPDVSRIAQRARLPVVNLTLPALRQLKANEFRQFNETMDWLITSDEEIDLFEFVLQKIIQRHLESQFGTTRRAVVQYYSIKPLLPDCAVLLSALAYVGSGNAAEISKAFESGAPFLRSPDGDVSLQENAQCGLEQVDAALDRLAQAAPQIKKNLLEACVHVVGADGVIQEAEAELLRAVADTLDCPIPPFVEAE